MNYKYDVFEINRTNMCTIFDSIKEDDRVITDCRYKYVIEVKLLKKVIVFIIIMVMCFLLISCGQSSHTDGNENQVSTPEKTQPVETLNIDETKANVVEYDPILNNWPELFRISPP